MKWTHYSVACANRLIVAILATLSAGMVSAATSYSVADEVLTVTVPEGETNSVDATQLAVANANSVTNIVKTGLGALVMDDKTAIPQYAGDINIENGMWVIACTNALGKLSSKADCSDVGAVFVKEGGSLAVGGSDRAISNVGKKIYIAGSGVNGEGALTMALATAAGDYSSGVLGRNIELAGDATIGHYLKYTVYFTQANTSWNLNGYKLTITHDPVNNRGYVIGGTDKSQIFGPGDIEMKDGAYMIFQGKTLMVGDNGTIAFKDSSKFGSTGMRGRYEWPMVWDSINRISMQRQTTADAVTNRNTWHGPVQLCRTMGVDITGSGTFGLSGAVSGEGGLDLKFAHKYNSPLPTNFVNLANAGSTFMGGVSVSDLALNVMERDAVPQNGGALALTNSIVNFEPEKNYALPDGYIHVKEGAVMSLNNGSGKWKTVVKTGPGTVNWNSAVGADALVIKEGSVDLSLQHNGFAGLIEGVEYFDNNSECYYAAENKNLMWTNNVVLSPNYVYAGTGSYWSNKRPEWDTEKLLTSSATVYQGYMWNRETTNVNWTFCCRVATVSFFYFDGVKEIADGEATKARLVTIENVTPGPHPFRIGSYAIFGKGGASGAATNFEWPKLGFRWDPLGRGSSDTNNFVKLEDPGDGSLFTWAIPGEDVFYPGTEESNKIGYKPRFEKVEFGSAATLDFNGIALSVGEVEGFPRVVESDGFTIERKWTLDAADIAAGFKVSGEKIDLGEDVELVVENPLAAKAVSGVREWTVLESAAEISGSISIKDEDAAKRWAVTVDGNLVKLKYRPIGSVMVVR